MTTVTIDLRDLSYAELRAMYRLAKSQCNKDLENTILRFFADNNYDLKYLKSSKK